MHVTGSYVDSGSPKEWHWVNGHNNAWIIVAIEWQAEVGLFVWYQLAIEIRSWVGEKVIGEGEREREWEEKK